MKISIPSEAKEGDKKIKCDRCTCTWTDKYEGSNRDLELLTFAIEMDRSFGAEWNRFVNDANTIFFTDGEHIEVPVVRSEWNIQIVELFFVLINIDSKPTPVTITVIVIDVAVKTRQAKS